MAAKREVLEETGIQADFKCLISFRHGHDYSFGCSDIYMIAYLTPQNFEIEKCKREISECKWMKVQVVPQILFSHCQISRIIFISNLLILT